MAGYLAVTERVSPEGCEMSFPLTPRQAIEVQVDVVDSVLKDREQIAIPQPFTDEVFERGVEEIEQRGARVVREPWRAASLNLSLLAEAGSP